MEYFFKSSNFTIEVVAILVDFRITFGAFPASKASFHLEAQRHHKSPWTRPLNSNSGLGVDKSFPTDFENSKNSEEAVTRQLIEFMEKYVDKNKSPMCGNSICQDRRFMAKHMPELENFFHYRNLDVSVFKELSKRWKPEIIDGFKKAGKHEALADIMESIEELKYYREHFIKI